MRLKLKYQGQILDMGKLVSIIGDEYSIQANVKFQVNKDSEIKKFISDNHLERLFKCQQDTPDFLLLIFDTLFINADKLSIYFNED